jgi:hypothetical protein
VSRDATTWRIRATRRTWPWREGTTAVDWKVDRASRLMGPVKGLFGALDATASDALVALWVDDVCWQAHLVDWSARRPSRWHRQRRREWQREGEDLKLCRNRLRRDAEAALRPFDD